MTSSHTHTHTQRERERPDDVTTSKVAKVHPAFGRVDFPFLKPTSTLTRLCHCQSGVTHTVIWHYTNGVKSKRHLHSHGLVIRTLPPPPPSSIQGKTHVVYRIKDKIQSTKMSLSYSANTLITSEERNLSIMNRITCPKSYVIQMFHCTCIYMYEPQS